MNHEDPKVIQALIELCKKQDITRLIQVGAEDGYEANEIRKVVGCSAIAFEANFRCSSVSSDLEFHHKILGATDCMVNFYVHQNTGLSSQLKRNDNKETKTVLPQLRLDTICEAINVKPDALIVDTEGTTLDVLEGCGRLLNGMKLIYAEVQTHEIRPGMRLLPEVEKLLSIYGMTQHQGLPSYSNGPQGNYTWVR